jgi:dienelactone hydrolase
MVTKVSAEREVEVSIGDLRLPATLGIPPGAKGLVLFVHGSGSSRLSPRNVFVARELHEAGVATLLFDLLTEREDQVYETRFDIPLLTERTLAAAAWCREEPSLAPLPIGLFGASTGAAAALRAAAKLGRDVFAVVSRGGRPDLTGPALADVRSPTLLIVGERDITVLGLNRQAYAQIRAERDLAIVPHATHLFEEPGTLEEVARLAAGWFVSHLPR